MVPGDKIRNKFNYLEECFKQIKNCIQEVNDAPEHEKNSKAASVRSLMDEVEKILEKTIPKGIERLPDDLKESYQAEKQDAEENYNILKEQLEAAKNKSKFHFLQLKTFVDGRNDELTIDITTPKEQIIDIRNEEELKESRERALEKQRQKEIEIEKEKQLQIESKEGIDEVQDILEYYDQIIKELATISGINEETLRVADGIGQKLSEQTEQMEIIQSKLDTLGDTMGRAKNEMGTFLKGLATEKVKRKNLFFSHLFFRSLLVLLFVLLLFY